MSRSSRLTESNIHLFKRKNFKRVLLSPNQAALSIEVASFLKMDSTDVRYLQKFRKTLKTFGFSIIFFKKI